MIDTSDTGSSGFLSVGEGEKSTERHVHFWRVVGLCFALAFVIDGGAFLQIAPRMEIIETIICKLHFPDLIQSAPFNSTGGGSISVAGQDPRCKEGPVQSELAYLNGIQQLLDVIPNVLLAVPYGLLATKYGQRPVLALAALGLSLGFAWYQIVCWRPDIFPVRMIWLSSAFAIIGGGMSVAQTMVYTLLADVTDESSRVIIFLGLEAAVLIAVMLSTFFSSLLMEHDVWIPLHLGNATMFLGTGLVFFMPNTKTLVANQEQEYELLQDSDYSTSDESEMEPPPASNVAMIKSVLKLPDHRLLSVFKDKNVVLLLTLAFANGLGMDVQDVVLIYMSKRFELKFSEANSFLTLDAAVKLALLIIILPSASQLMIKYFRQQGYEKDLKLARLSGLLLVIGAIFLGISSQVAAARMGTIIFALGHGARPLTRSLLTAVISPENITMVYTAVGLIQSVADAISGPLYSSLFSLGVSLGGIRTGLPFLASGCLFVVSLVLWMFLPNSFQKLLRR